MTKKLGPLPIWAWGLIFGIGGYFLYERYVSGGSASSTSSTTGILDPNAVDPNTGLTYGEEESAAENANAASAGGLGSGGGTVDTTPSESGLTATGETGNEIQDLTGFLTALQGAGFQYAPNGTGSDTNAGSSVTTPANPPTVAASSHTSNQIDTHPGGPFYNWYIQVFGKPPAATVKTNSTAYQLWKNGVKATVAKATIGSGKTAGTVKAVTKTVQPTKPKAPSKPKTKPKPVKVKGP